MWKTFLIAVLALTLLSSCGALKKLVGKDSPMPWESITADLPISEAERKEILDYLNKGNLGKLKYGDFWSDTPKLGQR